MVLATKSKQKQKLITGQEQNQRLLAANAKANDFKINMVWS